MAQEQISQESRIKALELQVHTLTQAVQHLMIVCEPLLKLAQQAHAQQKGDPNEGALIQRL